MAELNSTPALQTYHTPQVKDLPEKVIRIKLDSDTLEVIERLGGVGHCSPNIRERRIAQRNGIERALAWVALAFLNSEGEERTEMLVDMVPVHMHLAAKIAERREISELTKLYNLPDTEKETLAS